jgi:hypothetical protein
MFCGERLAVLCDDLQTPLAGNKKDETSRFAIVIGFTEPTVTQ